MIMFANGTTVERKENVQRKRMGNMTVFPTDFASKKTSSIFVLLDLSPQHDPSYIMFVHLM
jgi:hypothetical protein